MNNYPTASSGSLLLPMKEGNAAVMQILELCNNIQQRQAILFIIQHLIFSTWLFSTSYQIPTELYIYADQLACLLCLTLGFLGYELLSFRQKLLNSYVQKNLKELQLVSWPEWFTKSSTDMNRSPMTSNINQPYPLSFNASNFIL